MAGRSDSDKQPLHWLGLEWAAARVFPFDKNDEVSPPSAVGIGGVFANNGSRAVAVGGRLYLKHDRYRLAVGAGTASVNFDLYGIGKVAGNTGIYVPLNSDGSGFLGEFLHRLRKGIYLGARAQFRSVTLSLNKEELESSDVTSQPPQGVADVIGQVGGDLLDQRTVSIGPRFQWDSRDNVFYPKRGLLTEFATDLFSRSLGSKFTYQDGRLSASVEQMLKGYPTASLFPGRRNRGRRRDEKAQGSHEKSQGADEDKVQKIVGETSMKTSLVAPLVIVLLLSAAGHSFAQRIIIEYDRDVNFSGYRKYDWKEHPFLKRHPESEQFTIAADLVRSDTNQTLMKRGYQPVDFEPEFYITQFITARIGQTLRSVAATTPYPNAYMWPGSWYSWSGAYFPAWDTEVENYVQGVLLLDIVDARTNKLLWRAVCKKKIDDLRKRHKDIEATVRKALKSFPPKYKQR